MANGYRIDCKQGYVLTDERGNIVEDHVGRHYVRPVVDASWRIAGFGTRFNSRFLVPLAHAAKGDDIGQGWVHDVDHGTRRMWCQPSYRRAVRVSRVVLPERARG